VALPRKDALIARTNSWPSELDARGVLPRKKELYQKKCPAERRSGAEEAG
jgi:hypothetical protein